MARIKPNMMNSEWVGFVESSPESWRLKADIETGKACALADISEYSGNIDFTLTELNGAASRIADALERIANIMEAQQRDAGRNCTLDCFGGDGE